MVGGWRLYNSQKKVIYMDDWKEVLCQKLAKYKNLNRKWGLSLEKHLRYVSIYSLTTLTCPSVFGWYVVLYLSVVPYILKNYFHNLIRNSGSRSEMMDFRNLWRRNTSFAKLEARSVAQNFVVRATEWAYFTRRSLITQIKLCSKELWRCVMKSMLSSFHTLLDSRSGCSNHFSFVFDTYWVNMLRNVYKNTLCLCIDMVMIKKLIVLQYWA